MKNEKFRILFSIPIVLAIIAGGYCYFDRPLAAYCRNLPPPIVNLFQIITIFGVSTWYLVCSALLFLYFHYIAHRRVLADRMLYLFSAVAASGLIAIALKWIAGRWRPKVFIPDGLYGFHLFGVGYEQTSFPSGHAATVCSLAFVLSAILPRCRWPFYGFALLVCASRVVIVSHYASDVVMGAYVGILSAFLLGKYPPFGDSVHNPRCP
jgi:membrane-associated phospholipid phosphatase